MPAKSKAQLAAMKAAATGDSDLGIPRDVGREYVEKTSKKKAASLPEKVSKKKKPKAKKKRASHTGRRA